MVAENLSEEEITGLMEMFKSMDTDSSRTITLDELRNGFSNLGSKVSESEVRQLMEAVPSLVLFSTTVIAAVRFTANEYQTLVCQRSVHYSSSIIL